ncbi:phosphotransferase [Paenibacillaceae bacterium WGS1546]|uniref:phosphotransferase n=1 Tax=Cohnella sp. WGS1546 TaxID=3366810 RepID=UPI00372D1ABB
MARNCPPLSVVVYEPLEGGHSMKVPAIARQFGVKATKHKKVRGGIYRIVAAGGSAYSLKRMPKQIARLKWVDRMLLKVRQSGSLVAWRDPRKPAGQKPYAISPEGKLFVLTPWLSGRHPSPRSLKDMRACGMALARFHRAGRTGLASNFAYNEMGNWHSKLRARELYIRNKIAQANRHGLREPLNRMIKQNGPEIVGYIRQAKSLFRSSGYHSLRANPRKNGVLSHGDGGPSNFILNGKGTHLIDFETLHVDLRAYDLYRVIYNSCKDHQWKFSIAKAILDGYRRVAGLNRSDYKLIRAWLRFPHSTYLVVTPFKRIPFTASRLQWALKSERRIGPFLAKLDQYAKRNSSNMAG